MTFPDSEDSVQNCIEMGKVDAIVNTALRTTLNQAKKEGRMTQGAYECAKLLESDPDSVMLCVLPVSTDSQDVTVIIQHTLMEAFCWEHDIPLLKVDSATKLAQVFVDGLAKDTDNSGVSSRNNTAINCLLLQSPHSGLSPADKTMCDFYNKVISSNAPSWPVINLQV